MPHPFPADAHGLILFANVRDLGRQSELYAAVAAGVIERVRRGVYREVAGPAVDSDPGESFAERHRGAYLATMRSPVFTSYSAAAIFGLPIIGHWPDDVYVMSRDRHGSRRPGVISIARTREHNFVAINGCAVTSVEFTLLQMARHAPLVAALTATDAALHVPRFGTGGALTTHELLRAEHERLKPYPGSRRADAVLRRATTLADTPLETGSRLLIEELGFAQPQLQHELWLPELGKRAFLDFYWPEVDAGAEADGRGKYRGAASRLRASGGRDERGAAAAAAAGRAADIVIAEKDRENAIRRQVASFDRWDWGEMGRRHPVEQRLRAMGVPVIRRPFIIS
ncbi:hypothetical protein [Agromyces ramosus]|uniref:Transcriptional regulator of viral defense system n=1 Tax=Agromyces ramosus TaxID=33879 RepID=A0ABU0R971_9MICO|nr:hypothetical protein [Agromyces ramosus]MDQ0894610.1 putative transcriptional regulator of viral defense system [Agromyces ramosus]